MAHHPMPERLRGVIKMLSDEATSALKSRGVRLQAGDIADWIAQYSPQAAKTLLTGAVNLTRPFTRGLGLIVSEFSDEHIEIKIPQHERLKDSRGHLHEAVLYAVASEALRLMWEKEIAETKIQIKQFECEIFGDLNEDLRCRFELLSMERQRLGFEAQNKKQAEGTAMVSILGLGERLVAQVNIRYLVRQPSLLETQK